MTYPRRLLSDGEEIVTEFRPHWRMLFIPAAWTVLAIAAAIVVAATPPEGGPVDLVLYIAVFVAWAYLGLWRFITWFFTHYVLTNERLITRRGVIARQGTEIPLENINDIRFSQTILERLLRSGDLLIESAGEMGQSRFHDIPHPEDFQSLLYQIREDRSGKLSGARPDDNEPTVRLERLAALLEKGAITQAEYEEKKQKLLGEI